MTKGIIKKKRRPKRHRRKRRVTPLRKYPKYSQNRGEKKQYYRRLHDDEISVGSLTEGAYSPAIGRLTSELNLTHQQTTGPYKDYYPITSHNYKLDPKIYLAREMSTGIKDTYDFI